MCAGSANRDERAFTDADTFDIDRDRGEAQNLGMGYGVHSCLGAALARMESVIALDKLLDFMPRYEIVPEGLHRVAMTNVIGWHNVPVRVLERRPRPPGGTARPSGNLCSARTRATVTWRNKVVEQP